MAPRYKDSDTVIVFNGKWVSWAHTVVAYSAFIGALIVGLSLHYHKIVQNEHYGYPQEWFPSVSSTIGDRYPERAVFQIFIAITSGPRFALVFLWYVLTSRPQSFLPRFVAYTGLFRTLTCGGWTYVTSTDDHDWHDIFMISYLVATLPWTLGCLALSPNNPTAIRYRTIFAACFFSTLVPLIYFFIQHKVHKVPGAYTIYAFFEWALVLFDVSFDAVTALDFENYEFVVKETGANRGGSGLLADQLVAMEKDKPIGNALNTPISWNDVLDAVADTYHGFVFWSMLTSLGLVVWYFPLWHMGISGFEVFVMSTVSPYFLGIGPFRKLALRHVRLVHLLSIIGLLSYLIPRPSARLFAVGFGVSMTCLGWTVTWLGERNSPTRLENKAIGWTAGLIFSSVAKFALKTNNPIWPIMHAPNGGWNKLGIAIAILAVVRSTRRVESSGYGMEPTNKTSGSSFLASLGLGGLLFGLHSLLSDSSTMIFWVWEGFPVRGPIAVHGVLIILAMVGGLVSSFYYRDTLSPRSRLLVSAAGGVLVTATNHWTGFIGALFVAYGFTSLSVPLVVSAIRYGPAWTFGTGFLIYNVLVLAHVWVVAYAFVPGGPLMREHTDWIVTATVLFLGLGVLNLPSSGSSGTGKWKQHKFGQIKSPFYIYILTAIQLFAVSVSYLRFPTNDYKPYHPEEKLITAGIWTIHFSLDNDMWSSERRIEKVVRELELDVVGLLETDNQRIIMGNRDQTQYLAEELGMYVDYGPGPDKHTWGCALLSKFPILNSTHHLLPSPVGELAPAIHATIEAYGELVDIFVFHSGQEEDPEDRRQQSEYLAKLMKGTPRPAMLLSYLVIKPGEGNYNTYIGEKSGMKDIDPSDWDRWCEYILYKGMKRSGYARVSRSTITDTEIQVGKFIVGEPEGGNELITESQVVEGQRFPMLFRGDGVRGHRYHVFDEPRYFAGADLYEA